MRGGVTDFLGREKTKEGDGTCCRHIQYFGIELRG